MKTIDAELDRVRRSIEKLKVEEALLLRLKASMSGQPAPDETRKRVTSVKPLVLDIMRTAGAEGMTSAEVERQVRESIPDVAEKTVGSVLSRLKGDGALAYSGERYYEKQFAPRGGPFVEGLRAVN